MAADMHERGGGARPGHTKGRASGTRYVYVSTTFSEVEARALMEWIAEHDPTMSKSEAIRRFALDGLKAEDG